jgi:hypothetical protein
MSNLKTEKEDVVVNSQQQHAFASSVELDFQ